MGWVGDCLATLPKTWMALRATSAKVLMIGNVDPIENCVDGLDVVGVVGIAVPLLVSLWSSEPRSEE